MCIRDRLNTHFYKILLIISIWSFYIANNREYNIIKILSKVGIYSNYAIIQNILCLNFIIMILLISKKINFRELVIHKSFYYKKTKSIGEYNVNFIAESSKLYSKFVLIRNREMCIRDRYCWRNY